MDISLILSRRYPGAEWTLNGDSYAGLTWLSEGDAPSEAELQAEWAQVEFEVAYEAVETARTVAYRDTSDPIFFQYQRGDKTEAEWLDAVEAVKVANPYPVVVVEPDLSLRPADPVANPLPEEKAAK
jgi:hypothetical protein